MIYRFHLLNANVGDVLYMRKDGMIKAVKIVKFFCGNKPTAARYDNTYVFLLVAGEGEKPQEFYIGWEKESFLYPTIEDCINGTNAITKRIIPAKEMAEKCGCEVVTEYTSFGMRYEGMWKFYWNEYLPKRVCVALSEYNFVDDGNGWRMEVYKKSYEKEPKKYYDTYEECIADNQVKVVVF